MNENNQQSSLPNTPLQPDIVPTPVETKPIKNKRKLVLLIGLPVIISAVVVGYMTLNTDRNTIRSNASYESGLPTPQSQIKPTTVIQDPIVEEINNIVIPDVTNDLEQIEKDINTL